MEKEENSAGANSLRTAQRMVVCRVASRITSHTAPKLRTLIKYRPDQKQTAAPGVFGGMAATSADNWGLQTPIIGLFTLLQNLRLQHP